MGTHHLEDEKEYSEKCKKCDFEATAERKYIVFQLLNIHKKEQHPKGCGECDFKPQNLQALKRHEKNVHGNITVSTSPPAKKKRKSIEIISQTVENMDTEENVLNLSVQLEDIELEEMDTDDRIDDFDRVKRKLSENMDKKIIEKQKTLDQMEKKWEEFKLVREKRKNEKESKFLKIKRKLKRLKNRGVKIEERGLQKRKQKRQKMF